MYPVLRWRFQHKQRPCRVVEGGKLTVAHTSNAEVPTTRGQKPLLSIAV